MAVADRLMRIESWARQAVARKPGHAASIAALWRFRLEALREGLIDPVPGESPKTIEARIDALEEAFAGAGRCNRCGRSLSDPESKKRGIGPDCWAHLQATNAAVEGRRSTNEESPSCP